MGAGPTNRGMAQLNLGFVYVGLQNRLDIVAPSTAALKLASVFPRAVEPERHRETEEKKAAAPAPSAPPAGAGQPGTRPIGAAGVVEV